MTHSIHKEGDILQIYFCVIFLKTRHHAQAHITSGAFIHCVLSLAVRRIQMAAELGCCGQCLLWRPSSRKTFFVPKHGLPTSLGSFELPQSNSSTEGAWNLRNI